jgi:hypothetical protein
MDKSEKQKANLKRQKAKGWHFLFLLSLFLRKRRSPLKKLLPFAICLLPFDLAL